MKKNFNVRNLIIVMLCITIICMGIGFVYLSVLLQNEYNKIENFDVSIIKVEADTPIKGGIASPVGSKVISNEGKTVDFTLTLNVPGDELAYTLTLKNTGTLPAKIINIIEYPECSNKAENSEFIKPIIITRTEIKNKVLEPDEEIELKVVASYGKTNTVIQKTLSYQLTVIAAMKEE